MSFGSPARALVAALSLSLVAALGCKPHNPEKAAIAAEPNRTSADVSDSKQPATELAASDVKATAVSSSSSKAPSAADPLDWPMWRGPQMNGFSIETGIADEWDLEGKNVLWKNETIGTRSTPIIMNGKLYTLARSEAETPREGERVVCADAATGKVLWENKWNIFLSDVPKERVAWGVVVGDPATGNVYAQSVNGYFQCLDGETGKTIWSRSMTEEYGLLSTYGGRTNVPTIFGDLVITSAVMTNWGDLAVPTHRFIAYDKHTGEVVWFTGTTPRPADTTYCTPVTSFFDGKAAMVTGAGDGFVWAMQPRTGVPLWKYHITIRGVNTTPVIESGIVYTSQSEENFPEVQTMGQVAAIKGDAGKGGEDITKTGALWADKGIMIGRSSMVKVGDRLYGADDSGNLYIMNAKTGEQIGKRIKLAGTIMRASLLYADGKIFAGSATAWHVLTPTETGAKITQRLRFPDGEEMHGSPIISHGRLYVPTTEAIYCIVDPEKKSGVLPESERPPVAVEAPLTDKKPATALLVPAEEMIKSGDKVKYRVRLYNAAGQFLEETTKAKFSIDGPGQIAADGTYTSESGAAHSGMNVKAEVEGLTAVARLRVIPDLPWKWDFSDKQIPVTWIGMRYRHQFREVDGNPMMVKITTIPLGTKSRGWFGRDDLHDYTIQADVRSAVAGKKEAPPADAKDKQAAEGPVDAEEMKMADVGLIAQRYTLDLMAKQQLQLRTWDSELDRWSKTVPFAWKPDTWYTIKLQASTEGDKTVLRGKVWERDAKEPAEWSIEATDEGGHKRGSPGMFGNATYAELFIDNITVTPNP